MKHLSPGAVPASHRPYLMDNPRPQTSSGFPPPLPPAGPPPPRSNFKKWLAPLTLLGVLLWKLKGVLVSLLKFGKFIPAMLKSGGTMFLRFCFGLIAALVYGMSHTQVDPRARQNTTPQLAR